VRLDTSLQAGELNAFGRHWPGDRPVSVVDGKGKALHLVVTQKFGEIRVERPFDAIPAPPKKPTITKNPAEKEVVTP